MAFWRADSTGEGYELNKASWHAWVIVEMIIDVNLVIKITDLNNLNQTDNISEKFRCFILESASALSSISDETHSKICER